MEFFSASSAKETRTKDTSSHPADGTSEVPAAYLFLAALLYAFVFITRTLHLLCFFNTMSKLVWIHDEKFST